MSSSNRGDINRTITTDSNHPTLDASQSLSRESLILHKNIERPDPSDFLPTAVKHRHCHYRLGRDEPSNPTSTSGQLRRLARR
ncbi:hypothetical protein AB0H77_19000 [Streptomyces sp. NPDC050844]|uniref:hypothetical protein n=1 Tax=Streptomyces sp. NPDC050844 TaxID=3155790 RepID=UPI0033CB1415